MKKIVSLLFIVWAFGHNSIASTKRTSLAPERVQASKATEYCRFKNSGHMIQKGASSGTLVASAEKKKGRK